MLSSTEPDAVNSISTVVLTSTKLRVQWTAPLKGNYDGYELTFYKQTAGSAVEQFTQTFTKTDSRIQEFDRFTPGSQIIIKIKTYVSNGKSVPKEASATLSMLLCHKLAFPNF